jgi:hypothetical protein
VHRLSIRMCSYFWVENERMIGKAHWMKSVVVLALEWGVNLDIDFRKEGASLKKRVTRGIRKFY